MNFWFQKQSCMHNKFWVNPNILRQSRVSLKVRVHCQFGVFRRSILKSTILRQTFLIPQGCVPNYVTPKPTSNDWFFAVGTPWPYYLGDEFWNWTYNPQNSWRIYRPGGIWNITPGNILGPSSVFSGPPWSAESGCKSRDISFQETCKHISSTQNK